MRILNDNGYIGINSNKMHGTVTVLVSDDEGCAVLALDIDQCNQTIAALIEARNALMEFRKREFNEPD